MALFNEKAMLVLLFLIFLRMGMCIDSTMTPLREYAPERSSRISFSQRWDILGPFQIGTREATWGADPLEYLGGFRSLLYDPNLRYHSSLTSDGMVSWTSQQANLSKSYPDVAIADLTVSFPEVDWEFMRSIYGWAAIQYQAWARGNLIVDADSPETLVLYSDNVLEFWVDDQLHFGGDFYGYRIAPLVLHLEPGYHKVDVRLVHDVRAMGGVGEPSLCVRMEAQKANGGVVVVGDLLLPDLVDGKLASHVGSATIRSEENEWIEIWDIQTVDSVFVVAMTADVPFRLAPGQTRQLVFHVSSTTGITPDRLSLKIFFGMKGKSSPLSYITVSHSFSHRSIHEPHKVTFLLSSRSLSYSILRPPSEIVKSQFSSNQSLPVLLNLHGAGLEADSHQVRHMLDAVPDLHAWVIFPSGVTPWSGDDWHTLGFSDVEAGITNILDWIKTVEWKGPSVDTKKWLVSGHSNGGQGTWHALTHHPDRIMGGAPVSGYSSIQAYVPYTNWRVADPKITNIIQGALSDYRHELLIENFVGIPVMQQHGSADDNVPVYHSRKMNQLIFQANGSSTYSELQGKGHWFDKVMTTSELSRFYEQTLSKEQAKPSLPLNFSIIVSNPASMSSRGGIIFDQLMSPNQLGRMLILRDRRAISWTIKTSNILRFHISTHDFKGSLPQEVNIDGYPINLLSSSLGAEQSFIRSTDGSWQMLHNIHWKALEQRFGRQLGSLDSILRTRGKHLIYSSDAETLKVCIQITRNLFQYFRADAEIITKERIQGEAGNIIRIEIGPVASLSPLPSFPISIAQGKGISVRDTHGCRKLYKFEEGLGAIFLSPLPDERLELKIWGFDRHGLEQAARLLPTLTGVGQPEFIVIGKRCGWEGAAGVIAMGSFDSSWNISDGSFLL